MESRNSGVVLIYNTFGDRDVSNYIVYGGTSPDNLVPMDTTVTTYSHLTELENNTHYYFNVYSVNKQGEKSEPSRTVDIFVKIRNPGE